MECPQCGHSWVMLPCPQCGQDTPPTGKYCCHCGALMPKAASPSPLADRILCSDGNCTGIINSQGVCGTCGLPYQPDPPDETPHG